MIKRVGILTRHCYPNYGSILQAYALQTAIKKLGANPYVIDYVNKNDTPFGMVDANLSISSFGGTWWKRIIYRLIQTPTFVSSGLVFRKHQKRLLNLTATVKDVEGLKAVTSDLDIVVVGSDQVWNRILSSIDPVYYISFIKETERKVSYAASLGSTKPLDEDAKELLKQVGKLKEISVREPSSAEWLNANGLKARSDLDPVLLHNKAFWQAFGGVTTRKKPYILVYQLHKSKIFELRLKEIQKKHRLPIIRVTPDWKRIFQSGWTKILVSPESFIAEIRDATLVVTDSFHGTAFSLKLGTPLYVIPPGKYSTRLIDVLSRVSLEKLVVPFDLTEPLPISPFYNSDEVEKLLDEQASGSIDYLKGILR